MKGMERRILVGMMARMKEIQMEIIQSFGTEMENLKEEMRRREEE